MFRNPTRRHPGEDAIFRRRLHSGALEAGMGAWQALPLLFHRPLVTLNRRRSQLAARHTQVDGHTVHFLEGGRGEPVVLLHGLFSEKDHWVELARHLTERHRVLIPDLPGFGQSTRLADASYAYGPQVERLHGLLARLGVGRAHLAGCSFGGTLAALYAARHPEGVHSLAFLGAPHGLKSPRPSEGDRLTDAGQMPFIARSPEEFRQLLERLFARPPLMPLPLLVATQQKALREAEGNVRLWQEYLRDRCLLQERLPELRVRSLAVWGERDAIFDVSGAEVLRRRLPGCQVVVMAGVGHLPMLEVPGETGRLYRDFLRG